MAINWDEVAGYAQGTCKTPAAILEHFDIEYEADDETLTEELLDRNIELCKGCSWWLESCELESEDDEQCGYCEDCRG